MAASWDDLAPGRVAVVQMDVAEGLAQPGLLLVPVAAVLTAGTYGVRRSRDLLRG